jgi:hypothetical protein
MCIMCLEILKGRMTISEGRKALTELVETTEEKDLLKHYKELDEADDEKMLEIINSLDT